MKILYICTHNRCRSILSEAITNHLSHGKILAKSAGSQPAGQVHPLSILHLQQAGINTDNLVSQSWDELESFAPDVVVTVCDSAAAESCPLWFGTAIKLHWGLADPSKVIGTSDEISQAFNSTINEISSRVEQLLSLHHNLSDRQALRAELTAFGAN
jgi:arsenate reductase